MSFSQEHRHFKLTNNSRLDLRFNTFAKQLGQSLLLYLSELKTTSSLLPTQKSYFRLDFPHTVSFIFPSEYNQLPPQFVQKMERKKAEKKKSIHEHRHIIITAHTVTWRAKTSLQYKIIIADNRKYHKISNMIHESLIIIIIIFIIIMICVTTYERTNVHIWPVDSEQASLTCAKPPTLTSPTAFFFKQPKWKCHRGRGFLSD